MKQFFSCDKPNSSRKNIIINNNNSSAKERKKRNEDQKLLSTNTNNDSTYNLEIIEYPYSSNINDDTTVKMSSNYKSEVTKKKINEMTSNQLRMKEQKENMKFFNFTDS